MVPDLVPIGPHTDRCPPFLKKKIYQIGHRFCKPNGGWGSAKVNVLSKNACWIDFLFSSLLTADSETNFSIVAQLVESSSLKCFQ